MTFVKMNSCEGLIVSLTENKRFCQSLVALQNLDVNKSLNFDIKKYLNEKKVQKVHPTDPVKYMLYEISDDVNTNTRR